MMSTTNIVTEKVAIALTKLPHSDVWVNPAWVRGVRSAVLPGRTVLTFDGFNGSVSVKSTPGLVLDAVGVRQIGHIIPTADVPEVVIPGTRMLVHPTQIVMVRAVAGRNGVTQVCVAGKENPVQVAVPVGEVLERFAESIHLYS